MTIKPEQVLDKDKNREFAIQPVMRGDITLLSMTTKQKSVYK